MNLMRHFIILTSLLVLTAGCDKTAKERRLPRHSGASGELLVVMEDDLWFGPEGDSLRSIFEAYVPMLPQAEPRFSLLHFRIDQMSDMLKHHRNIIEVEINEDLAVENQGVKIFRDKWSQHQLVFTARSTNRAQLRELVSNQFERIAEVVDITERDRLVANYDKTHNGELRALALEKFGIDIRVPLDAELAKENSNFLWFKRERVKYKGNNAHEIVQGYFVFRYPYRGEESLQPSAILAARDSVLQKYVPGPEPGTYMTTEYRFDPESEVVNMNDRYTVLTKGLWRTENYFMGGPFACLTTTSDDGNYVVSISGFVFAPNFPKREYIREIEAVMHGAQFAKTAQAAIGAPH